MRKSTAVAAQRVSVFWALRLFWAVFGLGVLIALLSAHRATASEKSADPGLCEMVAAFDEALQLRFYRANFAPDQFDCHFYGAEGCPYSTFGAFRIKVTHVASLGCEQGGDCSFLARQVCETEGPSAACRTIMSSPQTQYQVRGRFSELKNGVWRLTNWVREPGPILKLDRTDIATACPQLRAG